MSHPPSRPSPFDRLAVLGLALVGDVESRRWGGDQRDEGSKGARSRPARAGGALRGFTLIELMVVVLIITLMSAIAIPSIGRRMKIYRARITAEQVSAIYRTARLRAMGRGSAVWVEVNGGVFTIREAIQGTTRTDTCDTLPETQCTLPATRWNNDDRSQIIQQAWIGRATEDFELTVRFRNPANASQEIVRPQLAICYSPLGRAYSNMAAAGTLAEMNSAPAIDISRRDGVGIDRTVLITPQGAARVVAAP